MKKIVGHITVEVVIEYDDEKMTKEEALDDVYSHCPVKIEYVEDGVELIECDFVDSKIIEVYDMGHNRKNCSLDH